MDHYLWDSVPETSRVAHSRPRIEKKNPEKTYQTSSLNDNVVLDFIDMSSSFLIIAEARITGSFDIISRHKILSVDFASEIQVSFILFVRDAPIYLLPSSRAAAFDGPKTGIGIALIY